MKQLINIFLAISLAGLVCLPLQMVLAMPSPFLVAPEEEEIEEIEKTQIKKKPVSSEELATAAAVIVSTAVAGYLLQADIEDSLLSALETAKQAEERILNSASMVASNIEGAIKAKVERLIELGVSGKEAIKPFLGQMSHKLMQIQIKAKGAVDLLAEKIGDSLAQIQLTAEQKAPEATRIALEIGEKIKQVFIQAHQLGMSAKEALEKAIREALQEAKQEGGEEVKVMARKAIEEAINQGKLDPIVPEISLADVIEPEELEEIIPVGEEEIGLEGFAGELIETPIIEETETIDVEPELVGPELEVGPYGLEN